MKHFFSAFCILCALCLGLALPPVDAQVVPANTPPAQTQVQPAATTAPMVAPIEDTDHFTIQAGAFLLSSIKTTLNLSGPNGQVGDDVDLTRTLGGKSSLTVFRADAEWRFASNHKIQLAFYEISQRTTHVIDTSFEWGGQSYPVNATVNTHFGTAIYKLNYAYTFYRSSNHEFSALIGAHITRFSSSIGLQSSGVAEGASATAPLPVIGLEWKGQFEEGLTAQVSYQYFGISIDNKYSGHLSDFVAVVEKNISKNWRVGGGYDRYVVAAAVSGERLNLKLRHQYNGLMLFVATSF